MEILRTDGGGRSTNDDRLKRFRSLIQRLEIPKICLIQDHKGELNVYWVEMPDDEHMELIRLLWYIENEYLINHFLSPSNMPLK